MTEIKPLKMDVSAYDRMILGSPVWWYTFAPAMKTFLNTYDLSGKMVFPFHKRRLDWAYIQGL